MEKRYADYWESIFTRMGCAVELAPYGTDQQPRWGLYVTSNVGITYTVASHHAALSLYTQLKPRVSA